MHTNRKTVFVQKGYKKGCQKNDTLLGIAEAIPIFCFLFMRELEKGQRLFS